MHTLKHRTLALIMSLIMILSCFAGMTFLVGAETSGDYEYEVLEDGTVSITKYNGSDSDITIPSEIDGKKVTKIGWAAFEDCNAFSIKLPNTVTIIGGYAFIRCTSLKNINIPDSVISIDMGAFSVCMSFTNITIPNSVKTIGDGAFNACTNLKKVTIPDSVTEIGDSAFGLFDGVNKVSDFTIYGYVNTSAENYATENGFNFVDLNSPDYADDNISSADEETNDDYEYSINGDGTVTLQRYKGNEENIVMPSEINGRTVTLLSQRLFDGCSNIKSVVLPDSSWMFVMDYFYDYVNQEMLNDLLKTTPNAYVRLFDNCVDLESISVSSNNPNLYTIDGVLFRKYKNDNILDYYPRGKKGDYVIPDGVTKISRMAFYGNENLTSVTLPDSLTTIEDRAFCGCSLLADITIPDSVLSIGEKVFSGCPNLTIRGSTGVFAEKYAVENQLNFVDDNVQPATNMDGSYVNYVDDNSVALSKYVGSDSDIVIPSQLYIPDKNRYFLVVAIDSYAFSDNDKITSVTIPKSVQSIKKSAFYNCKLLKTVKIPNSVTSIESYAFSGCSNLDNIEIPDSVTIMGDGVFSDCKNLTNIKLPTSITQIPDRFFMNCQNLANIDIPYGVVSIGSWAFSDCKKLKFVSIPGTVTTIEDYAFSSCTGLEGITIPYSVTAIDDNALGFSTRSTIHVIMGSKGSAAEEFARNNNIFFTENKCDHSQFEIIKDKNPTCTTSGETGIKYCLICKATLSESEEIPALGHTEEKIPAKPATCTEKGLTEGVKCAVCGEILTEQKEIPELGHYFENGKCTRCSEDDPSYKLTLSSDSKLTLSEDKAMVFGIPESTSGMTAGDFKSQISNKINIGIDDSAVITNGLKFSLGNTEYSIILKGDANADGKISAADARTILRIAAKLENPDDVTKESADINSDGKVTSSEARSVLRFAAKLDGKLIG